MNSQYPKLSNQADLKPVENFMYVNEGVLDTGWHQHEEHQLIYAENGVLYVHTHQSQFLLPAYHGAWIPAHFAHKLVSPSDRTRLWILYFQPRQEDAAFLQTVRIFGLSSLAREMLRYTERWSKNGENVAKSNPLAQSFYETIRLLAEEWCSKPLSLTLPHTTDKLLVNVTRYVLKNMGERLHVEHVAHMHGVSGRTLMRLFHSQLGMTFGAYLRTARIVKAVELLTSPSVSVLEVAFTVGYKSPSSFSQAFRRLTGMSPQEYASRQ